MGPMATYVFQNVIGFPMTIPEILYIPLLFKYHQRFGIRFRRKPNFLWCFILTIVLIAFAIINAEFSIVSILATGRSFLWMFMFVAIGTCVVINKNFLKALLYIAVGSLAGWCLYNYLIMGTPEYLWGNGVLGGNMIAIPYAFAVALLFDKNKWLIAFIFMMNVYISMTSGYRRQISVTIISMILAFLFSTVRSFNFKTFMLSTAILGGIIISLPQIEDKMYDLNPLVYSRVVSRTQQASQGNYTHGDQSRIDNVNKVFDDFFDLTFPHGFVSFQTSKDGRGIFVDVPTYMLAYTFGIIPLFVYILCYIVVSIKCFMRFLIYRNLICGFIFICAIATFALHFLEASMFSFSFTVPLTGLTLGLLFRKDHDKYDNMYPNQV